MSALDDLTTEISTQLQVLVSGGHIIKLSNQLGETGSINTTRLTAVCNHAARAVQRRLGRTVDDSDYDAVDFGVRIALLRMVSVYSATLTEAGAAYAAGVMAEMNEEAEARRQGTQGVELSDEDFVDLDDRYPGSTWDLSEDTDNR
jgi:hypothetical protein